jgi:plasmid stabilization system protein ParE
LPARDALARAHDYIDKLTKKHEALHKTKEMFVAGAKRHGNTFIQSSCTATTAAALGALNGRFGGEEGLISKWGVSLDAAVAFTGHVGGFIFSFADNDTTPRFDILAEVLHTVGDVGLAASVYRFCHKRGIEAAQRAIAAAPGAAASPASGAKGGAVYTVTHPK